MKIATEAGMALNTNKQTNWLRCAVIGQVGGDRQLHEPALQQRREENRQRRHQ